MFQKNFKIKNPKGIHLQPATLIAKFCLRKPELNLKIYKKDQVAHGDSVMSILSLELTTGSKVIIKTDQDDEKAIQYIEDILNGKIE